MAKNKNDCRRHSSKARTARDHYRAPLEDTIRQLPKNQGGAGKHKCAYCAYERGYEAALRQLQKGLKQLRREES